MHALSGHEPRKLPLFAWADATMAVLAILAISPFDRGAVMLLVDRYLGVHFFSCAGGGSAVLWMHFFWIFASSEV